MTTRAAPRPKTTPKRIIIAEPADVYHGKARKFLSSHQLADFRKSPLLYHRKKLGLIPDQDSPAYQVGRAAHTLILEGQDRFQEEYATGGPVNPNTDQIYGSQTKKYKEWVESVGKPVIPEAQVELIERMAAGVQAHPATADLLGMGVPEGVVRTQYRGMRCQIRMDWADTDRLSFVDLKTCDDLTWFVSDARRYGYVYQVAFYRAVFAKALKLVPRGVTVNIIAVEKREPFRCGVWRVDADVLEGAEIVNEEAIQEIKKCEEADAWPTGFEEVRVLDVL